MSKTERSNSNELYAQMLVVENKIVAFNVQKKH